MTDRQRERFDAIFEDVIDALPPHVRERLEEVPVVVEDRPSRELLRSMDLPEDELLCGLHTGVALTERSVEHSGVLPDEIRLFREGIVDLAGGWRQPHAEQEIYEEIRITLLHEIGHHFGLDEDDLEDLGYD